MQLAEDSALILISSLCYAAGQSSPVSQ